MCKADIFNEIIQVVSRETEIAPKVILSGSKEAQYLSGYVGQKMFPVAKKFLCEHCRNNLIKNHG